MMQQAITFVISRLANLADIDPSNVESSLIGRSIRIHDLVLRKDKLNTFLPFHIQSGQISELFVEIPWPTSNEPLNIGIKGTKLTLENNFSNKVSEEMSLVDIQIGITEESILGVSSISIPREENHEGNAITLMPINTPELDENSRTVSEIDDDDDDYMSCFSESDISNASFDLIEDETIPSNSRAGFFSFLRNAASQSMSWIMNRPIHIKLTDITLIVPFDWQSDVRIEILIKEVIVQIEPLKETGVESMKIVSIDFSSIVGYAFNNKQNKKILAIDNLGIRITSVYNSRGLLCRHNVAITLKGLFSIFFDEDALNIIKYCIINHQIRMNIPEYCRPFYHLRQPESRWLYAKNCIFAYLKDRRKRYNFNPSHLNFYAEARNTYLRLLDYCHRTGDITEKKESLAEVEVDLRYRDVIMYLRNKARERYSVTFSINNTLIDKSGQEKENSIVASSFHIDVKILCICLPSEASIWIRNIMYVSRLEETNFSLGSVTINTEGKVQALHGTSDAKPFLSFERAEKNGMLFTKVKLEELRLITRSIHILRILKPFVNIIPNLIQIIPQTKYNSSNLKIIQRIQTTSFILPFAQILFDDLLLESKKLSLTFIERDLGFPRMGALLNELTISFGNNEVILFPMKVEMTENDDIVVSMIKINISNSFWEYMKNLYYEWSEAIYVLNNLSKKKEVKVENFPICTSIDDIWNVVKMKNDYKVISKSQKLIFLSLNYNFNPLKLQINLESIEISRIKNINKEIAILIKVSSVVFFTDFINKAPYILKFSEAFLCVATKEKNSASRLFLSIESAEGIVKGDLSCTLFYAVNLQLAICKDLTYFSTDKANFFEAITVKPIRGLYRRLLSCTPSTKEPYLASYLQISVNFSIIHIDRLLSFEFNLLNEIFTNYADFLVNQVISVEAYRLFFSGLSDIALSISAESCPILFSNEESLICQINMNLPKSNLNKSLIKFGILLPDICDISPLTMINSCDTMSVTISIPSLYIELFHYKFSLIHTCLNIFSFIVVLPIEIQDFWDSDLRIKESVSRKINIISIKLNIGDFVKLELENLKYIQGIPSLCNEISGSLSESEFSSDASSIIGEEIGHVEIKNWNLQIQASPKNTVINELFNLYMDLQRIKNSLSKKCVIKDSLIQGKEYLIDETGPLFFDCPGNIIIVEDCTFYSSSSNINMMVCSGNHVYFRRNRFSGFNKQLITVEDDSATFLCENCEVVENPLNKTVSNDQVKKEKKNNIKLLLTIYQSSLDLILSQKSNLMFTLSSVELQFGATFHKTSIQLRLQRSRCDFIEDNTINSLISRLDIDMDWIIRHNNCNLILNLPIRIGTVSIPLSLINTTQNILKSWNIKQYNLVIPSRLYILPRKNFVFPYDKWKIFITISSIPIELCLPSGIPFSKIILANIAIWSKKEMTEDAFVEARVGIQEFSAWEFTSQMYNSILKKSLSVIIVVRTSDFINVNCDISLSPLDFSVSSEQIKCALSLLSFIQNDYKGNHYFAVDLENQIGMPITLWGATEELDLKNRLILKKKMLIFPHCVKAVNGKQVDHFEKAVFSFSDIKINELLRNVDVAVLDDGEKIHIVTRLNYGSLTQYVTFRTVFHILNNLPYVLKFSSSSNNDFILTILPGELSCMPLIYLDSTDIVMFLVCEENRLVSQEEPLSEYSPRNLINIAESRGEESIGRLKEFSFINLSAYVDVTYRLQGSFLTMLASPARPGIYNGTRFPIKLFLFVNDSLIEEVIVIPGETFITLKYDPFGPQLLYLFECKVHSKSFLSNEPIDLNSIDPVVGESIVMKHKEFPRRYFFELSIQREKSNGEFGPLVYSIIPRYIFALENNSFTDVEITSETGDSVGTLGGDALLCTSEENFAYLPLQTTLILRAGKAESSVFEVSENLEERILLCNLPESNDVLSVSHCFFLREQKFNSGHVMELIPALFFINMDPKRNLIVKHIIKQNNVINSNKWAHQFIVPSSEILPYTAISRYGYKDYFAFAWEDITKDSILLFSSPIEAAFTPKTDWTGFIQCGNTHHMVRINKKGPCDSAFVTISAPRRPYLTLVNLTSFVYNNDINSMSIYSYTPPSVNNNEIILYRGHTELKLPLDNNISLNIGDGVTAFIRCQLDSVTVIFSPIPINKIIQSNINGSYLFLNNQVTQEVDHVKSKGGNTLVRMDFKISQTSFTFRDGGDQPVHVDIESSELWLVFQSFRVTVQCTVSNVYVKTIYKGKKRYVVKPFCFDMTLRDVEVMTNTICAHSTQINLTQIELELSDMFLYQLQELIKHCSPNSGEIGGGRSFKKREIIMVEDSKFLRSKRIQLDSVIICEVNIIITYDRSVRPPEDIIFRGSPIGSLIPSLHRATMRLPTVRFREISGESGIEVFNIIREVLFVEFLKQIPSLVTSVVLFPSLSPLGSMITRVGSFIFGSNSASSDLPGTTLI